MRSRHVLNERCVELNLAILAYELRYRVLALSEPDRWSVDRLEGI